MNLPKIEHPHATRFRDLPHKGFVTIASAIATSEKSGDREREDGDR
ncbi:MAG: hypothetical protein AAFX40_08870 [Cyanobacteria bacterium J06639_1]